MGKQIRELFFRAIQKLPKFDGSDSFISAYQYFYSPEEQEELNRIRRLLFNPLLWEENKNKEQWVALGRK